MSTFTSVATVSWSYYEKRHRRVAEQNIRAMWQALGRPGRPAMPEDKTALIRMAMDLHKEMPE